MLESQSLRDKVGSWGLPTSPELYLTKFDLDNAEGDWRERVPSVLRNYWRILTDEARLAVYMALH